MKSVIISCFLFAMTLQAQNKPTVAQAEEFMKKAEAELSDLATRTNRAQWVQANFITDDTEALASDAIEHTTAVTTELIEQARQFEGLQLPPDLARKFMLLKLSLTAPAPKDPKLRREITEIGTSLEGDYGKGKYCRKPEECLDITAIERIMSTSRDPNELKDLGSGGTRSPHPCASVMRVLWNSPTRVREKSDSKIPARCGDPTTT